MQTLIFALVASIKLTYGKPILKGLLGRNDVAYPSDKVNQNGLVHGLNGVLGEPLCDLLVGCHNCDGLLEILQKPLGGTVNGLGLGVNSRGVVGGRRKDEDDDDDDEEEESDKKRYKKKEKKRDKSKEKKGDISKEPPKVADCFKIEKPIENEDHSVDGNTEYDINDDWDNCDDQQTDWDDCDCDDLDSDDCECDECGTDDSDCKDFDCSDCAT